MKNNLTRYMQYLLIFLFTTNCAYYTKHAESYRKAEQLFKESKLTNSFDNCIKSLKYHPDYYHSLLLIEKLLPQLIDRHHQKIEAIKIRKKKFYWDKVVYELEILKTIVSTVKNLNHRRSEYWLRVSNVRNYESELEIASQKAASLHYKVGLKLLEKKNTKNRLAAAEHFRTTLNYVDDFLNANTYYENHRYAGKIKLLIFPFNFSNISIKHHSEFYDMITLIQNSLLNNVLFYNSIEMIDLNNSSVIYNSSIGEISLEDAFTLAENHNATHIIIGDMALLEIDTPTYNDSTERITEGNIVDYNIYFDENKIAQIGKIYGNTQVELTKHTIDAKCKLSTNYSIYKVLNKQNLYSDKLTYTEEYLYEWGEFKGDPRVLNKKGKKLVSKNEVAPPSTAFMIKITLEKLINKIYNNSKKILKKEIKS